MASIYHCAVAPLVRFRLQTMPHLFGSANLHHQSVKSWQSVLFFLGGVFDAVQKTPTGEELVGGDRLIHIRTL